MRIPSGYEGEFAASFKPISEFPDGIDLNSRTIVDTTEHCRVVIIDDSDLTPTDGGATHSIGD